MCRCGIEFFEQHRFSLGCVADAGLEHIKELVVFVTNTMYVEDTAASACNNHSKIVHISHRISCLAVDVFNNSIQHIQWVVARLLPPLWERCYYEILPKRPQPKLIDHEDLGINVSRIITLALVPIYDLIAVARLRIDVVVKELIQSSADM